MYKSNNKEEGNLEKMDMGTKRSPEQGLIRALCRSQALNLSVPSAYWNIVIPTREIVYLINCSIALKKVPLTPGQEA